MDPNVVMAKILCGISHKDIKHTHKCCNNKTKKQKNNKNSNKYSFKIQWR